VAGGHKFHRGTIRTQGPWHPATARPGQRSFPLFGRRRKGGREELVIRSVSRDEEFAVCVYASRRVGRVLVRRLLERRGDGTGRNYRFVGWRPRRTGYQTEALVLDVDGEDAVLLLPEWGRVEEDGSEKVVETWTRLLPQAARVPGARLSCRADLGSDTAGELNVNDLELVSGGMLPARGWDQAGS
jgi:hypothetical protein